MLDLVLGLGVCYLGIKLARAANQVETAAKSLPEPPTPEPKQKQKTQEDPE